MFNKNRIIELLKDKGWTPYRLCKEANMTQSTLSDILNGRRKNPTAITLQKIASALGVTVDEFFSQTKDIDNPGINEEQIDVNIIKEAGEQYILNKYKDMPDFSDAEEAMKFILEQPSLMAYGGYDLKEMSDEEILELANDLLLALRISVERRNRKK